MIHECKYMSKWLSISTFMFYIYAHHMHTWVQTYCYMYVMKIKSSFYVSFMCRYAFVFSNQVCLKMTWWAASCDTPVYWKPLGSEKRDILSECHSTSSCSGNIHRFNYWVQEGTLLLLFGYTYYHSAKYMNRDVLTYGRVSTGWAVCLAILCHHHLKN